MLELVFAPAAQWISRSDQDIIDGKRQVMHCSVMLLSWHFTHTLLPHRLALVKNRFCHCCGCCHCCSCLQASVQFVVSPLPFCCANSCILILASPQELYYSCLSLMTSAALPKYFADMQRVFLQRQ